MDYRLFEDFITLQALLKDLGIIQSGGAIKGFLAQETVLFNGEDEKRRGKKIRIGDRIEIPSKNVQIRVIAPSPQEIADYQEDQAEKERVAQLVKSLNKDRKKEPVTIQEGPKKPVRFPGT